MLQITVPKERLTELCTRIDFNSTVDTEALGARLTDAGYTRVDLVEAVGQFAVRGGIIDVYPPGSEPTRIELFGDEIDRLGTFSIETQRFVDMIESEIVLPPVREVAVTAEKRTVLCDMIRKQIKKLGQTADNSDKQARAISVLQSELASLEHGFDINFGDKYLPTLFPESASMLDYLTGTVVLVDSVSVEERANASATLTEQSITDMVENLEMPPQKGGAYI